jgi:hypothetical protein
VSTGVIVDFRVPNATSAAVASDCGATGVLDAGTGSGLDTGGASELASGIPAPPAVGIEILAGTGLPRVVGDPTALLEAGASLRRGAILPIASETAFGLDPRLPIEQNALVPARRPLPEETGILGCSSAVSPAESLGSGAHGLPPPFEASSGTRADAPMSDELVVVRACAGALGIEAPARSESDCPTPFASGAGSIGNSLLATEARAYVRVVCALAAELRSAIRADPGIRLEYRHRLRADARAPLEAVRQRRFAIRADSRIRLEFRHRLKSDDPAPLEARRGAKPKS